ncbi:FtsX-like permease family protein [Cellulomonas sp. McL0617]|uniref:FtsX-like permease family protein n=1 Tax=Cellulomonas sp. McL0617 TaxID=3415675 RepID=UPI003CEF4D32
MTALTTLRVGARAATAEAVRVGRRRARADSGLLAFGAVVLAISVALSLVVPRLVAHAADDAVRVAVRDAGTSADLVARIGAPPGSTTRTADRDPNIAAELRASAADVRNAMPSALRSIAGPGSVSVATSVRVAVAGDTPISTRLVYVGTAAGPLVRWVDGAAPALAELPANDPTDPALPRRQLQVGLQADTAASLGVHVGDTVHGSLPTRGPVDIVVTGLYRATDADDAAWTGFGDLLSAQDPLAGSAQQGRAALLVTDDSLPDLQLVVLARSLVTTYRYATHADAFDAATAPQVGADLTRVQADPAVLRQTDGRSPTIDTDLGSVLGGAGTRLAAARAQESVVVVGLAGVAALVLVLAARLLVGRRETQVLGERARGASLGAVTTRALVESAPVALAAGLVGALVATAAVPGRTSSWGIAAGLVLVGALAPPVIAVNRARTAWSGRRQPANRADRDRLRRRRSTRRLVAEAALVVLAVGAFVSARGRGLLPAGGGDVDLLLAAAPLLAAAAVTVLVVHAVPPLLRAAGRVAQRGRGLVPVVATARAGSVAGAVVPLTALTMAVGMVVFCGTTTAIVRSGQAAAADERVGADLRVDGELTQQEVDALRASPDVTAVAGIAVQRSRSLGSGAGATVDLVLVDADALVTIDHAHGRDGGFARLVTGSATVPALVDPALAETVRLVPPRVLGDSGDVSLAVAGTLDDSTRVGSYTSGTVPRPRVVVDRATFDGTQHEPAELTTVLVDGPGAGRAVEALHLDDRAGVSVTTRDGWLAAWAAAPLNHGLVALLSGAAAVLAAYAALALVLLVVATSRERGRTLSALRTLGLDGRTGRAITLAELAPLAGAALLAGIAIGLGVPWLLAGTLGLDVATGGSHAPPPTVAWWPVLTAVLTVGGALVVAVLVESAVHRRDRLGDVLRVGER